MASGLLSFADAGEAWVYHATSASSSIFQAQTWQKPRGARMVAVFALAAGGAGANGASTAAGNGGVGGGSGAAAVWVAPAWVVPDVLYVFVGQGALAASGAASVVSAQPNAAVTASQSQIIRVGGGSNAGTGGTFTSSLFAVSSSGIQIGYPGQAGAAATTQTTGGDTTFGALTGGNTKASPTSGGASGGGSNGTTDHAGGQIIAPNVGWEPLVATIVGGAAGGTAGGDGITAALRALVAPFYATGGSGGGSLHTGTGGNGGNGGLGGGGGGGGSGTTGGKGGRGGDGIIVIEVL